MFNRFPKVKKLAKESFVVVKRWFPRIFLSGFATNSFDKLDPLLWSLLFEQPFLNTMHCQCFLIISLNTMHCLYNIISINNLESWPDAWNDNGFHGLTRLHKKKQFSQFQGILMKLAQCFMITKFCCSWLAYLWFLYCITSCKQLLLQTQIVRT